MTFLNPIILSVKMHIVIVLPTYNEKENVQILIPQLFAAAKKIKNNKLFILVVDDTSPDGTAAEVKKLQKQHKLLFLLSGEKQGLGVAYLRGFHYALQKLKADVLVMMDADLSHPAALIPSMIKEIANGADVVIGCRYIPSGATPDWNLKRRLISKGGNFFARIVAGLYRVHDCTSGFRAIRASVLQKIDTQQLHTKGYAFMITLLYELLAANAIVKEVPLVFYDRRFGVTKLTAKDMVSFFFNALRLRWKRMI